jgi:threonine aldolase
MRKLSVIARKKGLPVHLDGARLFNASLALGVQASDLATCVDSVQFCLSKGLGAPVGSLLCGTRDFIREAKQTRKLLGGGMRQAGIVAAAALVALEEGITRLEEDHENAKLLGRELAAFSRLQVMPVQTNIVMIKVASSGRTAPWFTKQLAGYGILASAASDEQLRFTMYRGIVRKDVVEAAARFHKFMSEHQKEFSA